MAPAPPPQGRCIVCQGTVDALDLECSGCGDWSHRRCQQLAAAAYPGGVYLCRRCLLAEAQLGGVPDSALEELADKAVAAAGSAVAESSAETYLSHRRRVARFAEQVLRLPAHAVFPRGPDADINRAHVCLFLAWAVQHYALSTIGGTLSALADWQRSRGIPAAASIRRDPMVQRLWAQLQREAAGGPAPPPALKPPFPIGLLVWLVAWLGSDAAPGTPAERSQDACWLVLGFFGMLRRSELAGLQLRDVRGVPGGGVELHIRRSKTDQRGEGATVVLAAESGSGIRIQALVAWHLRTAARDGGQGSHPLFTRRGEWGLRPVALGKADFNGRLRALLAEAMRQIGPSSPDLGVYTAHSLRRGGATAAANGGSPLEEIKAHGRWKSDAVRRYVQPAAAVRMQIVGRM